MALEPPIKLETNEMAIVKTIRNFETPSGSTTETYFAGRVIKIERRHETRNWSDTLDYSDFRTTECTFALVWLGTHSLPPRFVSKDNTPYVDSDLLCEEIHVWRKPWVRELEFHEQFAWVDCTNIFSDRNGFRLTCEVDSSFADSHKEPLMWVNYLAWLDYNETVRARELADLDAKREARERAEKEAEAKRNARLAKREARDSVEQAEANAILTRLPAKGTSITYQDFTGNLFWSGARKYRGRWKASVGLRNSSGAVIFVNASEIVR